MGDDIGTLRFGILSTSSVAPRFIGGLKRVRRRNRAGSRIKNS